MKTKILVLITAILAASIMMTSCGAAKQSASETEQNAAADNTVSVGNQTGEGSKLPEGSPAGTEEKVPENGAQAPGESSIGTILLSVNPEIEIDYDKNGIVIRLEGRNSDGKQIVASYGDFTGKNCTEVSRELIQMTYDAGFFEKDIGGRDRNIIVKLEHGSEKVDDDFLEEVAEGVRAIVKSKNRSSSTVVVDKKDLNAKGLIGLDAAKEIVLAQLGIPEAKFTDKEYELDDGVYEFEFNVGNIEYEYEVNAYTGKILEIDKEIDDD